MDKYIKRTIFVFISISLYFVSSIFAQIDGANNRLLLNGSFKIENNVVEFITEKNTVTISNGNDSSTVYIDFGNSSHLKLSPKFKKMNRASLNSLITQTDKNIYVQIGAKDDGTDYITNSAGYLVDGSNKQEPFEKAFVIISKDSLPINITVGNQKIEVLDFSSFDFTNLSNLEIVRKKFSVCDSFPSCNEDTIENLRNFEYRALDLNIGKYWKKNTKIQYFINDNEISVKDSIINLTDEICSKIDKEFVISYRIDFKHDEGYFTHSRKGELAKITVNSKTGSFLGLELSATNLWVIVGVVVVIAIAVIVILIRTNKKKNPLSPNGGDDVPVNVDDDTKIATNTDNQHSSIEKLQEELDAERGKSRDIQTKLDEANKKIRSLENTHQESPIASKREEEKRILEDQKKIKEDAIGSIISLIEDKNNKVLSDVIEKAKKDGDKKDNYELLKSIINMISMKLKDVQPVQPIKDIDNEDFTAGQMKKDSNRRKMICWVIDLLEEKGYKKLNRNGSIDDNISTLYNDIIFEQPSEQTIIDNAINNDSLTDIHKSVLLTRLIEKINSRIDKKSEYLSESLKVEEFVSKISEKLQSPATFEEAQENVRKSNLNAVNEILESEITDFGRESLETALKCALVKHLNNHLKELQTENLEEAMQKLSESMVYSKQLCEILEEYNASSNKELSSAIRNKLSEDILSSVASEVQTLFPETEYDSVQKLLNALLKHYREAKEANELLAGELEEKITMRNPDYISPENIDILELIKDYSNLVAENENSLKKDIDEKKSTIENLEKTVNEQKGDISALENKNNLLMNESSLLIDNLHTSAERVLQACRTILHPCSDNDENLCIDIEDRLFAELNMAVNRLKSFAVDADCVPAEVRRRIQQTLIDEISVENSPINIVCRYYAYSRLPFMTDTSREYGITFNRKNMSELYNAVESLYVQFGININIPDLFVAGFEEGNFENLTGQTYGDLDNLCQNSRNHFDNIDSNVKPSNVIVDVINVGYAVDGEVKRITSVLTY